MFTDMVGYTALGQRNESLSIALVEEQRRLVRPVLSKHGGREVKTMGDAFLVEFPNATDAARCAYDIQRTIREFNPSLAPEKRIHLRIGIHLGEVVESQEDISGDAVNVASRIEPLAEDGGICLSRQVYDQVQNKLDIALTSIGTKQLKNVSAPLEVFKMAMPWIGEQGVTVTQSRQRIAVLPFANMSPDPADEYFADGLTEELITKLSEIEGLRVIARTSVMNYKKREKSVLEIGRELAVGSVIEGSIRKSGNKVRITAQLINTQNEEHQWASTYDRELDDIFAIQSDVASKVASSLKAGILTGVERRETDDLRAYMFYLRASQLIHESTEQSLREAISLLEQAVSEDAAFARAHAGLASAWGRMVTGGYEDFTKGVARAEENARRALETGPELAESHAVMAMVHSFLDRYDQLRIEAEKATEINPNLVEAHIVLGINHITFGRLNKGIESFRKAYELDPLRFPAANHLALSLWEAGKTGDALEILGKMRELYPRNPRVYASLAECYMSKREFDKAQDMLDFGKKINPDETYVHLDQGILYALTGRKKEALGEIDYLNETKTEGVWLFGRLFIQTALGNLDEAFKALKRQVEIHSFPFNIGVHPIFKDLRKDSRYIEFCERTGIPTRARSG
jgi:adenylate cyclase